MNANEQATPQSAALPSHPQRLVVKVGTSVLTAGTDALNRPLMVDLARQIATLCAQRRDVLLVSSGAVAAGWERLGFPPRQSGKRPASVAFRQMLAAVGQSHLMHLYEQLFGLYDVTVAQALLTRGDLKDRQRYLNARNTLLACLDNQIVPVINENDAVATNDLRLGDNDTLSAYVANLLDADLLVILTDIHGLYNADPRQEPNAQIIPEVRHITEAIWEMAGGSGTQRGTGGMITKLRAADLAMQSGTPVVLTSGFEPNVLLRVVNGETLGTRFVSSRTHVESRKRWLLAETVLRSRVVVDAGAARALITQGRSLLPAGITAVTGSFERGQTVRIYDEQGREIARGLTQYSAEAVEQIRGCQSLDIAPTLGYAYGPEVVHRDDMVVLVPNASPSR